jgi:hypothetical protein
MEFCGLEINPSNGKLIDALQGVGDSGLTEEKGPIIHWRMSASYQPPRGELVFLMTTKRAFFFNTSLFGDKVKPASKIELNKEDLAQINISELSYRHQTGAIWDDYAMLTFIFVMKDGKKFERYLNLGKNETQINQTLPDVIKRIQLLTKLFPIEFGSSRSGAGGYTAGVWLPFPNN